ncbi:MAG: enoyl-CoA hydratase-related protein, partial [Candidatus Nezhaarchaeales archaeon]
VNELLKQSPIILAFAKMAVNKALETTLTEGLKCEADLFRLCFSTEDQKELSKAFLEKRPPVIKGR